MYYVKIFGVRYIYLESNALQFIEQLFLIFSNNDLKD